MLVQKHTKLFHPLCHEFGTNQPVHPVAATIKQRVDINGRDYWLVGKTNVDFKTNPITGRGGTASFRVNATLDDEAVDMCGRPLNHEPSF